MKAFKRIVDNQEEFPGVFPPSLGAQNKNFDELFQQLESRLVDMDFIQTIKDDPISLFEIKG